MTSNGPVAFGPRSQAERLVYGVATQRAQGQTVVTQEGRGPERIQAFLVAKNLERSLLDIELGLTASAAEEVVQLYQVFGRPRPRLLL